MSLSRQTLIHSHSNVYQNGAPKSPSASSIEFGEIAVNYNNTEPALFIKKNDGTIVKFNAITKQDIDGKADLDHTHSEYASVDHTHNEYAASDHTHSEYASTSHTHSEYEDSSNKVTSLTSACTDTQYPSAKVVYDSIGELNQDIEDNELVIAAALNKLNVTKQGLPIVLVYSMSGDSYTNVNNATCYDIFQTEEQIASNTPLFNEIRSGYTNIEVSLVYGGAEAIRVRDVIPTNNGDGSFFLTAANINGTFGDTGQFLNLACGFGANNDGNGWIEIGQLERISNKVSTLTSGCTDSEYPSAKVVYDKIIEKADKTEVLFEHGTGANSVVQKGNNNQAISEGAIALGYNNFAGVKGWYYKKVDFINNKIYLSATQVVPTSGTGTVETFTSNFTANNSLSIINKNKYDKQCKITAIEGNCITVDTLPFSSINPVTTLEHDDYSCFSIETPNAGQIDLGQNAVVIGDSCKAVKDAYAFGKSNEAYGNYAFVEGRGNKAGYGAHAEGKNTTASGQYSHTEGESTTASGIRSHAEGGITEATGTYAHAEGHANVTNGNASHVEGHNNLAGDYSGPKNEDTTATIGYFAHAEGNSTLAKGSASHAEGAATQALGRASHSEGRHTIAENNYAHAEGFDTHAGANPTNTNSTNADTIGLFTHAEGHFTRAIGSAAHAEGKGTEAKNIAEHAEGAWNLSNSGTSSATKTRHSIGIGAAGTTAEPDKNRKNAFEVMQNGDIYGYGIGGYNGTNPASTRSIQNVLPNLKEITYSSLKTLRNNSQLVPGQQYRITDYNTTVTGSNYTVGNHQFDIIVTADSTNKLNESARAIQHSGDTYFSNSKLESWELKYCLDNDTNRFDWANTSTGKGVIYYMKDEFNNECPYDFKNIMFYRKWNSSKSLWSDISTSSTSGAKPCYTFSSNGNSSTTSFTDYSLSKSNNIYNNVIKEYRNRNTITLNNNCFFGNYCNSNTFGTYCYYNTFGNDCNSNTFGTYCNSNTFGNDCNSNTFGNDCNSNTFGTYCYSNTFGNYCNSNTFRNDCNSNTFGNDCYNNTFGNYCNSNTFGTYCYYNTFGNYCNSNTFGNYCNSNTFGTYCYSNTLLSGVGYEDYGTGLILHNYAKNNIFESGIINVELLNDNIQNYYIKSSANHGNEMLYDVDIDTYDYYSFTIHSINASQIVVTFTEYNYETEEETTHTNITFNFAQNNHGLYSWANDNFNTIYTDSNSSTDCQIGDYGDVYEVGYSKLIINATPNLEYCTTVARKSNGKIVQYCEADLIADQN